MKKLLIADDSPDKVIFLGTCIRSYGPEDLRNVTLFIAETTAEAVELLLAHGDIGAGFIDYEIPTENGPFILRTARSMEKERNLSKLYLCLQTSELGSTLERYSADGQKAGADAAITTRFMGDKNPVDGIIEQLEKMRPFLLED